MSNLALALEPRRRYRDALPGATRPEVCIALDGALDQAARRRVARELIRRGNRTPVMDFASVAHVDLTEVTHLDSAGVELLNDLHLRLTAAGWLVRVTPPADIDARLSFHTAVIQGALRWV